MKDKTKPACALCEGKKCYNGQDCYDVGEEHRALYQDKRISRIHSAAAAVESRHYCKETRLGELMLFSAEMGYHKLGLAFCIGLSAEAKIVAKILSRDFEVASVCCKTAGIAKTTFELEQIRPENPEEVMCNPAGQANLLNLAKTELNIICGLCVGHDAIFSMVSKAPVTTLIAKDRVLAHNPAGAIYCQYINRKFNMEGKK